MAPSTSAPTPPLPGTSTTTAMDSAAPTQGRQRKRAQSFFSKSMTWLHDPEPLPQLPSGSTSSHPSRPSSRASTRTSFSAKGPSAGLSGQAWTLLGGSGRPKSAHGASPYGSSRKPPGSAPDLPSLSTSKANRLSRFLTGAVEPKVEIPSPTLQVGTFQGTFPQGTGTSQSPATLTTDHHQTPLPPLPTLHRLQPSPPPPSHPRDPAPNPPQQQTADAARAPATAQPSARPATSSHPPANSVSALLHPHSGTKQKSKSTGKRIAGVLSRTKSLHRRDGQMTPATSVPSTPTRAIARPINGALSLNSDAELSRSLPADRDQSLRSAYNPAAARAPSQDRAGDASESDKLSKSKLKKDKKMDDKAGKEAFTKGHNKSNGSSFFASHKASDGFGITKASRGFFSKLTRSSSSTEKVGAGFEEEYEPRLLKLPLVQQTRETRIARSYDNCRDKTEFWMPALPWRCIDYLNGKCEEEGLYRVSGGLTMVRRWRRRFDMERDVNLLDEPDLYDASVIASLFKEWIRELPEEIFPKARQAKVAATLPSDLPGNKPVPQSLRDELSNLPPFNYYLLFAITCHLSLLLSHESKNKMTLDNLYRCFNQSLKLDGKIFYTLVGDWRQCWQGCYTENEFLRAEYEFLNTPFPEYPELERRQPSTEPVPEEQAVTSSSGSANSDAGRSTPEAQRPATSQTQPSHSTENTETEPSAHTVVPRASEDTTSTSSLKPVVADSA